MDFLTNLTNSDTRAPTPLRGIKRSLDSDDPKDSTGSTHYISRDSVMSSSDSLSLAKDLKTLDDAHRLLSFIGVKELFTSLYPQELHSVEPELIRGEISQAVSKLERETNTNEYNLSNKRLLLGTIYLHGYADVKIDFRKALEFFKISKTSEGMNSMGVMNLFGMGTSKNHAEAGYYFAAADTDSGLDNFRTFLDLRGISKLERDDAIRRVLKDVENDEFQMYDSDIDYMNSLLNTYEPKLSTIREEHPHQVLERADDTDEMQF
jgi:hypothetical protein